MVRSLGGWWWWMLAVGYRCRGGQASGAAQCGVREGGTRRGVSLPRVAWVRCAGETLGNDFTATTATPRLVACAESRPVSNTSPFPRLPSLPPNHDYSALTAAQHTSLCTAPRGDSRVLRAVQRAVVLCCAGVFPTAAVVVW